MNRICKFCRYGGWDRNGFTGCFHSKNYGTSSAETCETDSCDQFENRTREERNRYWFELHNADVKYDEEFKE